MVLVACMMLCVLGSQFALAQSGAGAIEGTVKDTSGAIVPGAVVKIVNSATGVAVSTKTNSAGYYQVPDLFTGYYKITVSAPSFRAYETSLKLLVGQDAVINPVLSAGNVVQRVVVRGGGAQLVTRSNGTLTATLGSTQIKQLPINGRDLLTLTQETTPGLENSGQNVNGLQASALEYVVNGITTTQLLNGGEHNGFRQLVDPGSVQQVRMVLTNPGADSAMPAVGIVATKSGTNVLRGTLFETARNNAWGIAKDRQDPGTFAAPHYVRNEFGVDIGGPVYLPHVYDGRHKTFWFFGFERYSLADSSPASTNVPTIAMRQGDFSGLTNKNGILQVLYDPSTTYSTAHCAATGGNNPYCRQPFPNNQIPIGEESPLAKTVFQLIPTPTSSANPLVSNNLNIVSPAYEALTQTTVRLDEAFNENNHAFLFYHQMLDGTNSSTGVTNVAADGIPAGATGGYRNSPTYSHLASAQFTHVFSPVFFSSTSIGQQWFNTIFVTGIAPDTNYEKLLNLPNNLGNVGFPGIAGQLFQGLTGSQTRDQEYQRIFNADEDLTRIVGRHSLQFGARYRLFRVLDQPQGAKDVIHFNNQATAIYNPKTRANYGTLSNTGRGDASLFLGSADSYSQNLQPPVTRYHAMEIDGYLQDNFHVTPNLTLNLGLRYEAHPALWIKDGLANAFDLKNDAFVTAVPVSKLISEGYTTQAVITNDENIGIKFETPGQAGLPSKLFPGSNLNFLPRFGFAYQPFKRLGTVFRGGYGRYIFPIPYSAWVNQSIKNNPFTASWSQDYTAANQAIDGLPNELLRYNDPAVFGVAGQNTSGVVNTSATDSILPGLSANTVSTDWHPTTVTEANLTVEQPLSEDSAIRISWVYTHTADLPINFNYNNHPSNLQYELATGQVPPTGGASVIGTPQQNTYAATATGPYDQRTWGGGNTLYETAGWSNYNAVQLDYQRLFHKGSGYQISLVYAKSLATSGTVYPDANYPGVLGSAGKLSSPYGTIGFSGTPPPMRPSTLPAWEVWHDMIDYQAYGTDTSTPRMHIKFNGVYDLPVGRGKRFFGNAPRWVNEIVGGFRLAGVGQVVSQDFGVGSGDWGATNPIHVYKHGAPITDCRSGVCYKAYLWFNGFLPASETTNCSSNCVNGIPSNYTPYSSPIVTDPSSPYYLTNDVVVTLADGTQVTEGYDSGPRGANYQAKTVINGPTNWNVDLSLTKVFPITRRVTLHVDMDAFNAFNVQGFHNPGPDGVEDVSPGLGDASSYWAPRQIQLHANLTF